MKCCSLYTGQIYVSEAPLVSGYGAQYGMSYGGGEAGHVGRFIGNTTSFTVNIDYPQKDWFRRDIPYKDKFIDPNNVSLDFSISCNSRKNKELAFNGRYDQVFINQGSVIDEVVVPVTSFDAGDFIAFTYPVVDLSTVEIRRSDTNALLVLGQDYTLSNAGITLLNGFSSNIDLILDYDYNNQSFYELQTFIESSQPRGLFFKGRDVTQEKDITLTFGHVEFDPVGSYDYLSGEFSVVNITANVIPIEYSGSGLTDYFIEREF